MRVDLADSKNSVLTRPWHCSIATLFQDTIISPRGPKCAKKEKKYVLKNVCNISQNLISYGGFRKQPSLSKTQTCENFVLTVSKNCHPLLSLMAHCSFSIGPVDPSVWNAGKNTVKNYTMCTWLISSLRTFWLWPQFNRFSGQVF